MSIVNRNRLFNAEKGDCLYIFEILVKYIYRIVKSSILSLMEELAQLRESIEKHDFITALQIVDDLEEMSVEDRKSTRLNSSHWW